jgi:hypothetical protein
MLSRVSIPTSPHAEFKRTYWGLFRVRDKRIVWWHAFQSEAEALEAAGLSE